MTYFRLICIFGLAVTALILTVWLRGLGLRPWAARLISLGLMTLPGAQNAVVMANMPNTLTPLLCLSGGILALRSRRWKSLFAAWFLVGVAFFVYTPIVPLFFVPLTFALLLGASREPLWRQMARPLGLFLAAGAVFAKFGRQKYLDNPSALPAAYQMKLSPWNLPDNTSRFLTEILPRELKAWDVYGDLFGPFLLSLGLLFLLEHGKRRWPATLLAVMMFFGANVLYLFAQNVHILFRVMWPASMMLVGLSFLPALTSQRRWLYKVAIGGLSVGLLLTFYNNDRNVKHAAHEFALIKEALQTAPKNLDRIHIIAPSENRGLNGLPWISADEYNKPSTAYLPGFFVDMIRAAYIELGETRVVVPADLPDHLENGAVIDLKATALSDEYDVLLGAKKIGLLREGRQLKLLPWEARGEVNGDRNTLDLYRLGRWQRQEGSTGPSLIGRWKIAGREPMVFVSAAYAAEPPPADAFIIDINGKIPPKRD